MTSCVPPPMTLSYNPPSSRHPQNLRGKISKISIIRQNPPTGIRRPREKPLENAALHPAARSGQSQTCCSRTTAARSNAIAEPEPARQSPRRPSHRSTSACPTPSESTHGHPASCRRHDASTQGIDGQQPRGQRPHAGGGRTSPVQRGPLPSVLTRRCTDCTERRAPCSSGDSDRMQPLPA